MREREHILQKIELINKTLIKEDDILDFSILYVELLFTYCAYFNLNIYQLSPYYDQENDSLIISPLFDNAEFITPYFESLKLCHNVEYKMHGYDGFYKATFEYVLYNLLTNLDKQEVPVYSISWEQDFYNKSFSFLNNFIELYKSIEI